MSQDPDSLTASSRGFYERSKGKVALSILVAAASMMLLGFCSVAAGQSQAYSYIKSANSGGNTDVLAAYQCILYSILFPINCIIMRLIFNYHVQPW